uniref:Uncharacterized protein n=1 Tax=Syphacia muris TaxID=451379 RepID=A0A0N5AGX0_9BILA
MRSLIPISLILFVSFVDVHSSYCGEAAIPYSFQVLSDGQLLLGCARPLCFGWNANGEVAGELPKFHRTNSRNDGFLRDGDSEKKNFVKYDFYKTQTSTCEAKYESTSCDKPNQWVGGISPTANSDELLLKCCVYEGLELATDRGSAEVGAGQIIIGGEVFKKKRQYAFDYVSNIQKIADENGLITYNVTMKRFPCLSSLIEPKIEVEDRVLSFVNSMDGWSNNKSNAESNGKDTNVPEKQTEIKKLHKSKKQKAEKERSKSNKEEKIDLEKLEDEKIMRLLQAEREQNAVDNESTQSELKEESSSSKSSTKHKNGLAAKETTKHTLNSNANKMLHSIPGQNQPQPTQGSHIPGKPEKSKTATKLGRIPLPNLFYIQQPQLIQQPSYFNLPTPNTQQLTLPDFQQPVYPAYGLQQQLPQQQQTQLQPRNPEPQLHPQVVSDQQLQQAQLTAPQNQKYSQNQFATPYFQQPQPQQQQQLLQTSMQALPTLPQTQNLLPLLPWG